MGNTASNAHSHRERIHSPSPSPGNPHSSLRTKKKSLELPDLASLSLSNSRGRQHSTPPKSASIPIPAGPPPPSIIPGEAGRQRPAPSFPSTTDVLLTEPSTHIPFPPPSNSRLRDRQRSAQQHRLQELYNQSHVLPPPPPSPTASLPKFIPETVLSSLPLGLIKAVPTFNIPGIPPIEDASHPELVPGRITWRGGGKNVFLARAGDDDWKGRQPMERESPTSPVHHAIVALPPGTHHIRFLVDDQWRVADDLPTAVDDQGTLANYVDVPLSYSPPNPNAAAPATPSPPKTQHPPQTRRLQPGQSFWSAASSTDDESQDHPADHQYHSHHHHHTHQGPSTPQHRHAHHHGHSHSHHGGTWTNVLPQELIEAAREEEAYLNASSAETTTHTRGGTTYVNGFVPAPNIPPAPGLPRHLDKLILNSRALPPTQTGSASTRGSVAGGSTGGGKKHGATSGGGGGAGAGMGTGGSVGRKQGRDRERKEREREREKQERRKERRGGVPPAPPPSEAGDPPVVVTSASDTPNTQTPAQTPAPTPSGDSSIPTSPAISTPPTSPPLSGTNTPAAAAAAGAGASPTHGHGHGHGHVPSLSLPLASSPWISSSSHSAPIPHSTSTPTPASTRPLTLPLGLGLDVNEPALADDASVLPVPSHVVLHHLSTSAIRNGVLAVGNTTRYRKKYLTTVYYKPT